MPNIEAYYGDHFPIFDAIVGILERVVKAAKKRDLSDEEINKYARAVSVEIFELPETYTNKASKRALMSKFNDETFTWCKEHHWPRQASGEALVRKVADLKAVNDEMVFKFLIRVTEVNFVTPEENMLLKRYQKSHEFVDPVQSYKRAGIELLDWPKYTRIWRLPEIHPQLFK